MNVVCDAVTFETLSLMKPQADARNMMCLHVQTLSGQLQIMLEGVMDIKHALPVEPNTMTMCLRWVLMT